MIVTLPFKYAGESKDYPCDWDRRLPPGVTITGFTVVCDPGDIVITITSFIDRKTNMRLSGGTPSTGAPQQLLLTVTTNIPVPTPEILQCRVLIAVRR